MSQSKAGVVQTLLNIILFVPGLVYMALRESGKWLSKRVYNGGFVRSILIGLVGVGVAVTSSFSTASYLSNVQGWAMLAWFPSAVVVFVLSLTHVWPLLYWALLRHVWNFADWVLKQVYRFTKLVFKPLVAGAVGTLRQAPGSDYLWQMVEGKVDGKEGGKTWGIRLLQVILLIGVAAVATWVGYLTFQATAGLFTIPALAFLHLQEVVALAVAATAFFFSGASLFSLVDEGEAPGTAIIYSAAGAYALVTQTALVSATLPALALGIVSFLVGVTYVVPAFVALLQGGLVEKVLKAWGKLIESAYAEEDDKDFRRFYHHVMNIVLAVAIALVIKSVVTLFALPALAIWVLAGLAGLYSYAEGSREVLNRSGGNVVIGIAISALTAYFAWGALPYDGAWQVVGTVVALLGTGLLVYPFAYILVRALTSWAAPALGDLLEGLHKAFANTFKALREAVRKLQRAAFDDTTKFGPLSGHLLNLAVAWVAVTQALPLLSSVMPTTAWLAVALQAVVGINLFILLDRAFSRWGAETLALVAGGTALFLSGNAAYAATGDWLSTAVVALACASVVGGIVAPAAYLVIRVPANMLVTPWLAPIADTIFDAIWNTYTSTWAFIGKRFAFVTRVVMVVLAPIVVAVTAAWASVKGVLERLGGKSS